MSDVTQMMYISELQTENITLEIEKRVLKQLISDLKENIDKVLDYIALSGKPIFFGIEEIMTTSLPMKEEYMIIYPETKEVIFKTKLEVLKDIVKAEEDENKDQRCS